MDTAAWLANESTFAAVDPSWLAEMRHTARQRFLDDGFPGPRDEEWKYTSLAELQRGSFPAAGSAISTGVAIPASPGSDRPRLAFVNGAFVERLSTRGPVPEAVRLGSLTQNIADGFSAIESVFGRSFELDAKPLAALNTANFRDGAFLYLPRNCRVDAPIEFLFHVDPSRPVGVYPRVLIVAEDGAEATIIERYTSGDGLPYFTNAVTEVYLGENASVRHVKAQEESEEAFHIGLIAAHQARSSRFLSSSISFGAKLARTDILSVLDGEGAECVLDGLYVGRNRQHIDHHTAVDHRAPRATSRELYKGVLDDASTGVFNGKVFVRVDAQKSDAQQMNKNLLLSDSATVNTKPQLEILADDVKCSHGATVGRLDATALFYLRSRGIDALRAREILIYAFANEMLNRLPCEFLRAQLEASMSSRFAAAPTRVAA